MSRNFMCTNDELRKGDYLLSNNREYKAVFQNDGNFVIYGWKPTWASDTWGVADAYRLVMQEDCNLVMYTNIDKPCWNTATHTGGPGTRSRAFLRDDGVLVVENNGREVWNSTMSKGCK
ncbi:B-type lectin plumieribetin-like [Alosa pseudoharengus]|uniref:B-type lectin plumieribetin-like n=1 Tax=Alosa pseudoharengus TaxID=34774 RepID=UPI003F892AE1